jgi:zinc protease
MPADKIDIAIDLEADRMRNSLFEEEETSLERTVVISEREGNENEPLFRLGESIQKAAFKRHSYAHQVIGDLQDLKTISREKLYSHYCDHYTPDNALIAIAGDFDTDNVINKYSDTFGAISDKRKDYYDPDPESELPESNEIEIEGPGDTVYLQLSFRSPDAQSEDFFPLVVLDSLLTGPTSLAIFGGGSISNKTSRLYRALVEKDLAASISAGVQATIDPYLYEILAILQPDHPLDKVKMVIDDEIDRLKNGLVSEEEIQRAIKQAKALFAYGSESITNQTFWLGYASMFAEYTWFENYLDQLEKVTPQRVAETAKKYLDSDRRIVGVYKPRENGK